MDRREIRLKINAGPSKFMVMMSLALFEQLTTTAGSPKKNNLNLRGGKVGPPRRIHK